MIISHILNKCKDKEYYEDVAVGLAVGLAVGIAVVIAFGLAVGLAFGLAFGLVFVIAVVIAFVIAVGLAFGLAFGLAVGLASGIIDLASCTMQEILLVLIAIIAISEILYWLDKHKIGDIGRWGNTLIKKGEAIFETSCVILISRLVIVRYKDMLNFLSEQQEGIQTALSIIGYGTFVVLLIAGYIWINSLKYKEKP
jgi:hypothetical protein